MNIAEIGFKAQTGELKDAKTSLDALVPAATKAERAANNFNRAAAGITTSAGGAGTGIRSFAAAASGAAGSGDRLTKSTLGLGTGMGTVQRAAVGANAQINILGNSVKRVGTTFTQADAHITAYRAQLENVTPAANRAKSSLDRLGAAANDNINRLQSTPGNIAAQFQDIGVSAAGGMNPMLIALQQGTQLSSAMAGGLGNVIAGFRQLFSVTTILTVGLVGLAAAGFQMVDWMEVGKTLLLFLADAMETCGVAAAYLGVVLAIAFAPAILGRISAMVVSIGTTLVSAIGSATGAMIAFSLSNPFTALLLAIGLVIGAVILLEDKFGGVFTTITNIVRDTANFIASAFAKAFNDIINLAQGVTNAIISAYNWTMRMSGQDNLQTGPVDFSGALVDPNQDFVGNAISFVSDAASAGADWLRGLAGGMGGAEAGKSSSSASEADRTTKAYQDLIAATERRIAALRTETTALGMSEHAALLYRNQQDLMAQAIERNIPLTAAVRAELERLAQALTQGEIAKAMAEATKAYEDQQRVLRDQAELIGLSGYELLIATNYQKLVNQAVRDGVIDLNNMTDAMRAYIDVLNERAVTLAAAENANNVAGFMAGALTSHDEAIAAMQRERGELGLIGRDLAAYRRETELLASARKQNHDLSAADLAALRQQSREYALLREEVDLVRMRTELFRDAQMGFVTDLLGGLRQGQSAWEAFGNAVMNVANKIFDKLLEVVSSEVFSSFTSGGGGGGGGLFGSIMRGFRLFTGAAALPAALTGSVNSAMDANPNLFARGGAFGVERFANGGAFTNGIYTRPTLFKFASGGALGEMGEAGPEAVMPLKRGPNGSLGVVAHEREPVRVHVTVDDDRFNAYVDDRSGRQVEAAAPTIAQAGGKIAQRTGAIRSSRSLG